MYLKIARWCCLKLAMFTVISQTIMFIFLVALQTSKCLHFIIAMFTKISDSLMIISLMVCVMIFLRDIRAVYKIFRILHVLFLKLSLLFCHIITIISIICWTFVLVFLMFLKLSGQCCLIFTLFTLKADIAMLWFIMYLKMVRFFGLGIGCKNI